MNIKSSPFLIILSLALLSYSCSPYARLSKDFSKGPSSIQFIHTSNKNPDKTKVNVYVAKPLVSDRKFSSFGKIDKVYASVIPLIIYNGWEYKYQCSLGRTLIKEDLPNFIQASMVEESNRSGSYQANTDQSSSLLTLEVEVDSLGATSPFTNKGEFIYLFFAYFHHRYETTGAGTAYSRFHYRISSNDKTLDEGYVYSESSLEVFKGPATDFRRFHQNVRTHLVEMLGDTFKKNMEKIVFKIDMLVRYNDEIKAAR